MATSSAVARARTPRSESLAEHEQRFYAGFAGLVGDIEGCSRCVPLGGGSLGKGTPDIVGIIPGNPHALAPYGPRLIAGELKTGCDLLRGFGQAYGYRLFAHKCYLAVPRRDTAELNLLRAICGVARIGLVTFAPRLRDPGWLLELPAGLVSPDPRLLNERLTKLRRRLGV